MTSNFDEKNLERDVYEVVASWFSHKAPIPEPWRNETCPTYAMEFSDLQKLGLGCSNLVSRARRNARRLRALSDVLSEVSSAIREESSLAQTNYEAVSNMCGLVTLPTELLTRIMNAVVNEDQALTNPARWKAALTLSHVNQYFRNTALSLANLWTNINGRVGVASLSLLRSKDALLDVQFLVGFAEGTSYSGYDESYKLIWEHFVPYALPHSKRWRTLDIHFVSHRKVDRANFSYIGDQSTSKDFLQADVRSLESLYIRNDDCTGPFAGYYGFEHWDAPCLRHVKTEYYFPLALPALANLTSLEVTLQLSQIDIADVLEELSQMKVLQDFMLKLDASKGMTRVLFRTRLEDFRKTEFPSVRRVRIETEHHETIRFFSESLFSSLLFPEAIDLQVVLRGHIKKFYPEDDCPEPDLKDDIKFIFSHIEQFPRVQRLQLEANGKKLGGLGSSCTDCLEAQQGYINVFIPLNMFPSLKHLTLSSNGALSISEQSPNELVAHENVLGIESLTIKFPAQRQKNIWNIFDFEPFVRKVLQKQKNQGDWAAFRELVFMECIGQNQSGHQKENIVATYVGDAALAWRCGDLAISELQAQVPL